MFVCKIKGASSISNAIVTYLHPKNPSTSEKYTLNVSCETCMVN